ncbi:hypothetical protein BBJ28_00002762 [Nothophytophthora sp. Chile5]|nr:hypothetical protein BBJ28_00002762 [Nothophytophthora sp. Chile5]
MLAQCRNDVYRLYPRYFEPSLTVPLPGDVAGESTTPPVEVKRATEVATRGTCCTVDVSTLVAGQSLRLAAEDGGALAFAVGPPRQAISADSQAEQLMEQYECDLAISSSTLVTLFDSDTSTRFAQHPTGWGIPMKSRVIVRSDAKGSKKQIYLDRPLPGSSPSTREKIAEAGRAALLSRFEVREGLVGSTGQTSTATSGGVGADTPADESESSKQQPKKKAVPLSVFVKPDYRSLGVEEQLTTSERCRFWLHSWLRGSSTVLVARFNPKTGVVSAWETHSLTSLAYGDDTHQTLPLECFDCGVFLLCSDSPMAKFQWMTNLFAALADVPVGNYLLRLRGERIGTSRRERGLLEVLMATGEPVGGSASDESSSAVVDLHQYVTDNNKQSPTNPLLDSEFVPPAWNLPGRIPYTFHTGTYCQPFFLDGVCPRVADGEDCECMHLRLLQRGSARKSAKTGGCWRFENYSKVLKEAARTNFEVMKQPVNVTPDFAFCVDARAPPPSASLASLHARTYCAKPANECNLPHLTLHDVLERLADGMLRTERQRRRKYKGTNRRRHEHEQAT